MKLLNVFEISHFIKIFHILIFTLFVGIIRVQAQDLEPRSLSAMPIGGNIAIGSYIYSGGNILIDASLPIEDLDANLNNFAVGYLRSFKLFNKLTKFDVIVPYSLGHYAALVEGMDREEERNGFADPIFRISMILVGVKPLKPQDYFKEIPKKFKLGITFRTKVPIGAYNPSNFLNVGTNRWSFQTGIRASYDLKNKFIFEGHLNSWLFTENPDFFGGKSTHQAPLFGVQVHAAYVFKPGIWFAVSTGRTFGGELKVNGVENNIKQKNSRAGVAFAYRLNRKNGLKIAYTNGFSTRAGADFNSLVFAYTYIWFDKENTKR